ncbi:MAG: sodium:proton antiporter NhaD [Rikenellaceae bacterium]
MLFILMPVIFMIAIFCIAFEDKIHVNKAAVAISSAVMLWAMLFIGASSILGKGFSEEFNSISSRMISNSSTNITDQYYDFLSQFALIQHLGDVATTLFFVIGSMLIIEIIDSHGGFRVITNRIETTNKRRLMVIVCLLTFFMSAVLDNLATAILMVTIIRKFIPSAKDRILYSCMIIIAANAGGAWSPIGDVTTILLWTGGNLKPIHQMFHLFLPSFATMAIPMLLSLLFFKKNEQLEEVAKTSNRDAVVSLLSSKTRNFILIIGVLSLALVPVFNELTGLPPFMGVMFGVAILWMYTDIMYYRIKCIKEGYRRNVVQLFPKIDMSSIMFFFGILMSVAALNTAGQLTMASQFLDTTIHNPKIIAFILGICSSLLDNVALVAGAMGMYPLQAATTDLYAANFMVNGEFWTFLAYCCVTGGSILIIGSATGVAVMGMEKISFGYYLKKFTPLAIVGYLSGAAIYLLLF